MLAIMGMKAQTAVLEDIVRSYKPWISAEFNGKLVMDKLPVSPTVKMYMMRDSLIQISVRVPLLGEVGRCVMTKNEITVVNRMNKTYCRESTDKIREIDPSFLSDLQSIFLARVTVFGSGELGYEDFNLIGVQENGGEGWFLIPTPDEMPGNVSYGYMVGSNSRTQALVVETPRDDSLQVRYTYLNGGMQMLCEASSKGKKFTSKLDFSSVKWGGTRMTDVNLDSYTRLAAKDFMSSIAKK